ncbi:serine/threonine-protein kinase [Microcoleus sp. FACHB-672]|uniref:serine/threonine-protein kinase n=1 Tax=Microcoleus sp. FACHB-672 TaxID=2692825 RepID=UPI001685E453|nr:serine/threonine-protein kinase [Microcoleus sp. FACHB-672]MBD2043163.1 protein kinase [Microcoleus sp. FACHB-672]
MIAPALLNNRYQILQTVGSGGFGETFLAEDTQMPSARRCAIKQLKPVTNNPQINQIVQERFQREAAILEELGDSNPQIPRLYAYFSESAQFYLVQEWVEGETLTKKLKTAGLLSESSVRALLTNILPVLDYVHSKRIVHRDIKPDNIIWRQRDGLPVLIDFGAVKETMNTEVNSQENSSRSIAIGTPGFMPGEQAAGKPVYSSDLYALGLTAIYLLTGRLPQQLDSDAHTGEILWHRHALNLSPALVGVLDKAIQSHPQQRYPTAREMLNALHYSATAVTLPPAPPQATIPSPVPTVPPQTVQPVSNIPQTGGRLKNAIVAGLLVGASVITGVFLAKSQQPAVVVQPAASPSSAPQSEEAIESTPVDAAPAASPDPTPVIPTPIPSPDPPMMPAVAAIDRVPVTTANPAPVPSPEITPANPAPVATANPTVMPAPPVTPTANPPVPAVPTSKELDNIADRIFSERYPELAGRKIQPNETNLAQQWAQIRQCEAVVDYIFYQRHPELGGRKILPTETDLQQQWLNIREGVDGC